MIGGRGVRIGIITFVKRELRRRVRRKGMRGVCRCRRVILCLGRGDRWWVFGRRLWRRSRIFTDLVESSFFTISQPRRLISITLFVTL